MRTGRHAAAVVKIIRDRNEPVDVCTTCQRPQIKLHYCIDCIKAEEELVRAGTVGLTLFGDLNSSQILLSHVTARRRNTIAHAEEILCLVPVPLHPPRLPSLVK